MFQRVLDRACALPTSPNSLCTSERTLLDSCSMKLLNGSTRKSSGDLGAQEATLFGTFAICICQQICTRIYIYMYTHKYAHDGKEVGAFTNVDAPQVLHEQESKSPAVVFGLQPAKGTTASLKCRQHIVSSPPRLVNTLRVCKIAASLEDFPRTQIGFEEARN